MEFGHCDCEVVCRSCSSAFTSTGRRRRPAASPELTRLREVEEIVKRGYNKINGHYTFSTQEENRLTELLGEQ